MFLFQFGNVEKKTDTTKKDTSVRQVAVQENATDSAFIATAATADSNNAAKKTQGAQATKPTLKGEDDKNLSAALSEIRYFISKGDNATAEDKKRLEAKLEKVYSIVDYFQPLSYYSFESENTINDFKAQMAKSGIVGELSEKDVQAIVGLKEGGEVAVAIGNQKFTILLTKGKLEAYERLGLMDVVRKGYYKSAGRVVESTCKRWFANDRGSLNAITSDKMDYYKKQKNYAMAIEHATEAIRLDPTEAWRYYRRGNIHYDDPADKTYDQAIADYTRAIDLDPEGVFYESRGDAYYQREEYRKAIADYKVTKEKTTDVLYKKEMDGKIANANEKLVEQGKKPEKIEAASGSAGNLVKGAKKQVMPISKVDGFYERAVARLANQKGESVDETKAVYTEEEVNRVFKKAGDYIAEQSGGNILPKDWETKLIGGELVLSPQQLAVLESVCALWHGRTEAYAKASFDGVLKAGDVNAALLAIYDNSNGKSQIVEGMKSGTKAIGANATKYWQDIVFRKIMKDVEVGAKKEDARADDNTISNKSLLPKASVRGINYEKILSKTALEAYEAMEEPARKRELITFAASETAVENALSKNDSLTNGGQDARIAYLAKQQANAIFKSDGLGMDAEKIVNLLNEYDNEKSALDASAIRDANMPNLYGLLTDKYNEVVEAVVAESNWTILRDKAEKAIKTWVDNKQYRGYEDNDYAAAGLWAASIYGYYKGQK